SRDDAFEQVYVLLRWRSASAGDRFHPKCRQRDSGRGRIWLGDRIGWSRRSEEGECRFCVLQRVPRDERGSSAGVGFPCLVDERVEDRRVVWGDVAGEHAVPELLQEVWIHRNQRHTASFLSPQPTRKCDNHVVNEG